MTVEWVRVGVPQPDGYDTQVVLEYASQGKYSNPPNGDGPPIWPDGRARWTTLGQIPAPSFQQLAFNDPAVRSSLVLLDLWPEIRKQCAEVLMALCPLTVGRSGGHGCSCGNYRDDFGWIYVTADDPWGFAEGIVHEMGHWKLRALGIWFEEWTDLLLDHKADERYVSPVRKDVSRPMGAVLHAQYSYIHVTEMVYRMLQAAAMPTAADFDWLALQVKRISGGYETLQTHARGTTAGAEFLRGIQEWTSDVITRSQALLSQRCPA